MKPLSRSDIFDLLSPGALSYLFPGMPQPEEPGAPAHEAIFGMAMDADYSVAERPKQKIERKAAASILRQRKQSEPECCKAPEPDADALDPRTERILAEIRRLQEEYGVTIDELELMLGYTVKLSHLRITRSGRIILPEYDNKEVKMTNVAKALYFLYLRHPDGLRYKEIADHKDELLQIYGNISGRDDPAEIEKSIDLLVDPYGNALNVNASRVKTAFRNAVSDRIARFYYISGAAGDIKKVPLDRDLVIWEY